MPVPEIDMARFALKWDKEVCVRGGGELFSSKGKRWTSIFTRIYFRKAESVFLELVGGILLVRRIGRLVLANGIKLKG